MKNKSVLTGERAALRKQVRNRNEHNAITASHAQSRLALVHSQNTPHAMPTSCGLDDLWGITSNQGKMRLC